MPKRIHIPDLPATMTPEYRPAHRAPAHKLWAIVVASLLAWLLTAAPAQARDFPTDAKRGAVTAFDYPQVTIGKQKYQLVPATRIRDYSNLIIMPGAMPPTAEIMYRLDFSGFVREMWLLTPDEVKALGPAPKQ